VNTEINSKLSDANSDTQIGLRDIIAILIRRRYVVLGVVIPIVLMSLFGAMRSTDIAIANAKVMIEGKSIADPRFGRKTVDYDVMMSSAKQLAISMPVAELAAEVLWDSTLVLEQEDREFIGFANKKQLRIELMGGVDAGQVGESNVLEIEFTHLNTFFALLAVDAITDAYINLNMKNQQNSHALDYYTEQITDLQTEIDSLMFMRAEIFTEAGYTNLNSNSTAGIGHIKSMEYKYYTTKSDRVGLEARIRSIKAAIKKNEEFVPALTLGENQTILGNRSALDKARIELAELRSSYTEESVWVQRQIELVSFAKEQLIIARDAFVQDLEIEKAGILEMEKSLESAVAIQKADLIGYPEVERLVSSLNMRIDTQRDLLETLQMKRGEVRLSAESDLRISNITKLDKPTLTSNIAGGRKFIYVILAGILGLALGLVAAMFVENQDHRIYDSRQAVQMLGVPVLGTVSQISKTKK
jgi:uncharacterized protein involved in exopolysaccharide biosynthesis